MWVFISPEVNLKLFNPHDWHDFQCFYEVRDADEGKCDIRNDLNGVSDSIVGKCGT